MQQYKKHSIFYLLMNIDRTDSPFLAPEPKRGKNEPRLLILPQQNL